MNNTIKVILNDEKTISELAKDPDVLVRIKDAIIDGVSRRVAKTIESELEDSVRNSIKKAITDFTHSKNEIFERSLSFDAPKLTPKLIEEINTRIKLRVGYAVDEAINKAIVEYPPEKALNEAYNDKIDQIKGYDFDKAVSEYVKKRVGKVLSKMVDGSAE